MTKMSILKDKNIIGSPVLQISGLAMMLFVFWLFLSGTLETKFFVYGIFASIISAWIAYPLLLVPGEQSERKYFVFGLAPLKFIFYFAWLMWQLVLANIDVVKATVRAEVKINPKVMKFRFVVDNPMATVVLANSITLTPGTITMNVTDDGLFEVHALTDGAAEGLLDGSMQKKVAELFNEQYVFEPLGEEE